MTSEPSKPLVVIGTLGTTQDRRGKPWRPSVALCSHGANLPVARFEQWCYPVR